MKGLVRRLIIVSLLLINVVAGLAYGQTETVTIVANQSISNTQISAKQLRRIFTIRQSNWANGKPIQVFVLPSESEVHLAFCKQALSMFPYQIERMWNKFTYSGLGVKPIVVKNENEMLKMVAQTEGSIGYVGNLRIPDGVITMIVVKE